MNLVEALDQSGDMKLCLVQGQWAWFTSIADLNSQYGTSWWSTAMDYMDAGPPQVWHPRMLEDDIPISEYRILKIAFHCIKYLSPAEHPYFKNTIHNVDKMNTGKIPWLSKTIWENGDLSRIMAGTTLREFCRIIRGDGGDIYMEMR